MRGALVLAVFVLGVLGFNPGMAFQTPTADDALNEILNDERIFHYGENPGTGPRNKKRPLARSMRRESQADQDRRISAIKSFLDRLRQLDEAALSPENQLNQQMAIFSLEGQLLLLEHRAWRLPLHSDSGFHTSPARMWRGVSFQNKQDYEAYIERLSDLPRYFGEHKANLRVGMSEGFTMPKVVLDGLLPTFRAQIVDGPVDSSLYTPFLEMAETVGSEDQEQLRARAQQVIANQVMPAFKSLATFMENEYYPAGRDNISASSVPGGAAYYDAMVRYYTTLDISADEVHQIGLKEVARIRREMETIIKESKFEGSFEEFLVFLRTDPQFYAESEKQLLMTASFIAKNIDGRLPKLFGKLPRQPYGIEAVPASIAPNYTTGRYIRAPLDAPRGGYYWVNSFALKTRPLYNLPALTLHEAMPGHHLQIALAAELEHIPEFRSQVYPHAFGEGWGLYSEKLGLEMGIYQTPYEHFGRLSYEMWRASRLVIDTGIHSKGWTRAQAIALLEENSALSKHNIRTEVDRYIAWPGQALAYKMGELKILELRQRATTALGSAFDVRAFHDRVLSAGGIPLYLLEARIDAWIAEQQQVKAASR